jgi:hypothetical protein
MKDNKYITSDLYLGAFLKSKGQKMSVSKNKNKASFIFDETPELILLVNGYLNDEALCNPLTYANSIKNIKNLLYNL